jgi:predicted ArsR family transcriptional regulator
MKESKSIREELLAVLRTFPVNSPAVLPESIADELGVTRRAVEWTLARLEEEGLVKWHRKSPGGHRRPWWPVTVLAPITKEVQP